MMARMHAGRVAALVAVGVLVSASPAGATTVLANQQDPWFYWIAPILAVVAVLSIVGLTLGYSRKALFPKYRGRKVRDGPRPRRPARPGRRRRTRSTGRSRR